MAREFSQKYIIDYSKTFSLVVRLASICILVSMAVNLNSPLHQLDISNSFSYGDLDEEVYMEQPPRYMLLVESAKVCHLQKAINRLK